MVLSFMSFAYAFAALFPVVLTIKHALREITKLNKDKVVVITGASSGIGKACAKEFYNKGCQVVLCSRNLTKLQEVKEELLTKNNTEDTCNEPCVVQLDVSDPDSISRAVEDITNKFPNGIHVLLNNAGMSYRGEILSTSMDVHRKVMETNYFGQIALTKALLPSMLKLPYKERTRAHILLINSIQGIISIPQRSAYSASKFACTSYFDCLRAELSSLGIRVCNIHPSYVKTNLSRAAICGDGSDFGVLDKNQASGMDPGYVGKQIVNAVEYNKEEVVISEITPILAIWIRFFSPFLFFRLMDRRSKKKSD